ncbi:MAG: 4Fe-4S binding protein, partial [Firmicutes bacterium]|nr:4Fe-4S binding protein [Bacillota bacterium]
MKRLIIKIDEEKCNGCGLCVPACAEGAIQIIDGKAKLVGENLCDGLGACLGDCPQGAITLEEREAEPFDKKAVAEHLDKLKQKDTERNLPCGCPGSAVQQFNILGETAKEGIAQKKKADSSSRLQQWPVQLSLVPLKAPFFKDNRIFICADCVPFAFADFHEQFLNRGGLVVGCPKLDDAQSYLTKLTKMIKENTIKEINIAIMEVPCCRS